MSTITLARSQAMPAIASAPLFQAGEAAIASYAWKQLTTIGSSVTLVNGAVSASDLVIVDDVTTLTVGDFYEWGAGGPWAHILAVDPFSNTAQLDRTITVADNATVKPVTLGAGAVSGLSYNTTTGVLSGTPDTNGTTTGLLYEATDTAGQKAYSTTFDIVVSTPPIPPSFAGALNSEAFDLNEIVSLDWSVGFVAVDTYALIGTLPTGLMFNTFTAAVTGVVLEVGLFGPFTVTGTNGVAPDAQSNTLTITVSQPDVVVLPAGLLLNRPGMLLRQFLLGEP